MQQSDLERVVSIESQAQVNPWSRTAFTESLASGHLGQCLLLDQVVVGYLIVQVIVDELHLLNLVVAPLQQGQGYAHILMDNLFKLAAQHNCSKIFLEVRESNKPAQGLYQSWGFKHLSVRKNYYQTPNSQQRETALVYVRELPTD